MLKLGIDARGIDVGPGAGIAHATRELVDALCTQAKRFDVELTTYRERISGFELRRRLQRAGIDHVLVPTGAVSPWLKGKVFPWAHDLAIFAHPEWFPQSTFRRFVTTTLYLSGLRRSRHVFAVSEDTKKDVLRIAGLDESHVTVTYQGIVSSNTELRVTNVDQPYALILGTVEPRKNIAFIDSVWNDVRLQVPDAKLIVAGNKGWGNVSLSHTERIERLSDMDRDRLIAGASMLLLPSLHEGFGRTALEAMSLGVPVIGSIRGAIPEVIANAGTLLEPDDRQGWIRAIVEGFNGNLNGKSGIERARGFSWEKTAGIMLAKIVECW